ncbi:hypothetical protein OEZ86_011788 [Tetradesmus obliquus]|nr:hypothetical protein OEZ86_011788 [Tetradesmus obliquus]
MARPLLRSSKRGREISTETPPTTTWSVSAIKMCNRTSSDAENNSSKVFPRGRRISCSTSAESMAIARLQTNTRRRLA